MSRCQREGRGFKPHRPLQINNRALKKLRAFSQEPVKFFLKGTNMIKGIAWAVSEIPGACIKKGRIFAEGKEVVFKKFNSDKSPLFDDYSVSYASSKIVISGNNDRAKIFGLLELSEQVKKGVREDKTVNLKFLTRNYKHQSSFKKGERSIHNYTKAFWESLCHELLRHNFNGIVFYIDSYHPFQFFLDYNKYPEARVIPVTEARKNCDAFNTFLEMAKEYGIRTHMQNYVTHMTANFAKSRGLAIDDESRSRVAGMLNPDCIEYSKYVFAETFKALPELSGLYMNFESAPDSFEFIRDAVIPVFNKMKKKPVITYRLWNFTLPEEMVKLVRSYKGESSLSHKVMDTSDTYSYPMADSRIVEWRKYLGNSAGIGYCFGPCHNCGTNIDDLLWTDPAFIYKTLEDAKKKGADFLGFHTAYELMAPHLKDAVKSLPKQDNELGFMNYFHLETATRFFKGEKFDENKWLGYFKKHFNLDDKHAPSVYQAIKDTSAIVPLVYQQFHHTSAAEGFQVPVKLNFIQDPFMYYPVSHLNGEAKRDFHARYCWINKKLDYKAAPDVYQYIIDYVNPRKQKSKMNPLKISNLIRQKAVSSFKVIENYYKESKDPAFKSIAYYANINYLMGMWAADEIVAAINLYKCYFSATKSDFVKNMREGIKWLYKTKKTLDIKDPFVQKHVSRLPTTYNVKYDPQVFIAPFEQIVKKVEERDFPFAAFLAFVESRREFNEIRRKLRPDESHSRNKFAFALKQISKSKKLAGKAIKLLSPVKHGSLISNVRDWINYLDYTAGRIQTPELICDRSNGTVKKMAGHLGQDICFRHCDFFYEDFDGFFDKQEYAKVDDLSFTLTDTGKALRVDFLHTGEDIEKLEGVYDSIKGTDGESWYMRLMIDAGTSGRNIQAFDVAPRGRWVQKRKIENFNKHYSRVSLAEPAPFVKTEYVPEKYSYRLSITIPYSAIGKKPKKGSVWGFNLVSNAVIGARRNFSWRANFEWHSDPYLTGKVIFK